MKNTPPATPAVTPNSILQMWVREQGFTPAEFGRRMGYKSQMPYYLIGPNPSRLVTDETIGRLLRRFGKKAIAVSLQLAEALDQQLTTSN